MTKENVIINEYHLNRNQPDRPQFVIHDLSSYLKKNKDDATRPHIHSFYQIIWFRRGKGLHFVDFKEYEVFNNTVFFIAKNQVHYFDENTRYTGVLLHFNETFLVQHHNETDFFLKYNIFNGTSQQPLCRVDRNLDNILNEYMLQITRELNGKETFGREESLSAYLRLFLIQIQRRKNKIEKNESAKSFDLNEKRTKLAEFVHLVDEHYHTRLSVSRYARLLHISLRTLSDITRQALNKTPSQIIQERIVLEARRLLLHSSQNVNQIGYRLGFEDASYFVRYFKKHTGISPLEFRKAVFQVSLPPREAKVPGPTGKTGLRQWKEK